jgi:putative membrane-bound dehydrogenase-like protein
MKNNFSVLLVISIISILVSLSNCKETNKPIYPNESTSISANMASDLSKKIRSSVNAEIHEDLELALWASDTLVNDPIAISVDEKGRIYYTLAERIENSEFDIRGHRNWMTASISFETVEDRRNFIRKTFSETNEEGERFLKDLNNDGTLDWRDLTVEKEQVWIVSDTDEDGLADHSKMFISDFHEEISDLANGVEYFNGEVFLSVGPDLWRIKDNDGDDIADEKTSISHGYTIHIAFGAHGMSGVTIGPQGRIWWGTGDIGTNVVDQNGKRWKYPNQGAIVRSDPDGSNFEVFAAGLRNTHEFTFDKHGNLISEDNDGDHQGERERLVYLINGSDSGWRINWQFGKYTDPDNNRYKVWMDERMSVPRWDGQAAWFLPPITNYVNGPTGFVYNPGTALSPQWYDHFFVAEFRGTPANSPIHAFKLKNDGAGFALDTTMIVAKGLLPTGIDFGPDGALYFADWIDGWNVKNEGRIWKLDVPGAADSPTRQEVKQLIGANFSERSIEDLTLLLAHKDQRIRRKTQFELVARGGEGFKVFKEQAANNKDQLARIHSIWGIAQLARTQDEEYVELLTSFLDDADSEVLTQSIKMLGDLKYNPAAKAIIPHLQHESPRVQMHATEALGRMEVKPAVQPIIALMEANNDKDLWIRHAGMVALGRIGDAESLAALKDHPSKAVRTAAVIALRRMASPKIAVYLNDPSEYIVAEAARGINDDYSIEGALPDLARILSNNRFNNEALLRRAINAALRVGDTESMQLLIDYTQNKSAPAAMRAEAIAALSTWTKPSPLDRVDGRYRGEITRDGTALKQNFYKPIASLLNANNPEVQAAAIIAVGKLKFSGNDDTLMRLVKTNRSPDVRIAAIQALNATESDQLGKALEIAINDRDNKVRSAALAILPESTIEPEKAVALFTNVMQTGSINEQQAALGALAEINHPSAIAPLKKAMQSLLDKTVPKEIHLDIIEAVEAKNDNSLSSILETYRGSKPDGPLSEYIETIHGGDKDRGRNLFYNHEAAQCVRCHAVFERGGNAGPGLAGVGNRLSKEKLLESMIEPSAELAAGYGVASLELKNGEQVSGVVAGEDETTISLKVGKGDITEISKSEIANREDIPSSMPPMGSILTKKELRDMVAFLADLKEVH